MNGIKFLSISFSASIEINNVGFKWGITGVVSVFYKVTLVMENFKSERLGRKLLEFSM